MDLVMFEQLKQAIFDKDVLVFPHATFSTTKSSEPMVVLATGDFEKTLHVTKHNNMQAIVLKEHSVSANDVPEAFQNMVSSIPSVITSILCENGVFRKDDYDFFYQERVVYDEKNIFDNEYGLDFDNKLKKYGVNIYELEKNKISNVKNAPSTISVLISDDQSKEKSPNITSDIIDSDKNGEIRNAKNVIPPIRNFISNKPKKGSSGKSKEDKLTKAKDRFY